MRSVKINVLANTPYRVDIPGREIVPVSIGDASSVSLRLFEGGVEVGSLQEVKKNWRIITSQKFSGFEVTSAVNASLHFVVTDGAISVSADSLEVNNGSGNPIPVNIVSPDPLPVEVTGSIELTASSVTIDTSGGPVDVAIDTSGGPVDTLETDASTITASSVAANDTEQALLAAAATRRAFTVRNAGSNAVALMPAGTSYANAAIIIEPGEIYEIDKAARAAWKCRCDAGLTTTLKIYAYTL